MFYLSGKMCLVAVLFRTNLISPGNVCAGDWVSNFHPLEVVDRCSETQPQVDENVYYCAIKMMTGHP